MNFTSLKNIDEGLNIIKGIDEEVEGITDFKNCKEGSLLFISSKDYFSKMNELQSRNFFIIISEEVMRSLGGEEKGQLEKEWKGVGASKKIGLSMSLLSHAFFKREKSGWNEGQDGRDLGDSNIDSSCLISANVFIGSKVSIGKNTRIHPGCSIGPGCNIGDDCEIFPNVTIYPNSLIKNSVRIHSSTVIGGDGFGYHFDQGVHHKIWHSGGVHIEDDVEIGSNTCIDQGTFSPTFIGCGSKIDNHVQVAHNCRLGKGVILCGGVGMAGSAEIGDYCVVGGAAGIGNGVIIGEQTQVAGMAVVNKSWPKGSAIGGIPARPIKEWLNGLAAIRKLSKK